MGLQHLCISRQVHGETDILFKCAKCSAEFESQGAYVIHMRSHIAVPVTCPGCKKTYPDKYMLRQHQRLNKECDVREWICHVCAKPFGKYDGRCCFIMVLPRCLDKCPE